LNRKEPQPLGETVYVANVQDGKNGSIQKNGRNPPHAVVKKPAPPSPPPPSPKIKSQ
jgi:hypothetical protein